MPIALFDMPDGSTQQFPVPDGTSPEDAQSMFMQHIGGNATPPAAPAAPTNIPYSSNPGASQKFQEGYNTKVGEGLAEKALTADKTKDALAQQIIDIENAGRAIRESKDMLSQHHWFDTGYIGDKLKDVAGTNAYALQQQLQQVKSAVAVDKLMKMKADSKTGASGFGSLSGPELSLLETNQGSMELGQGDERLSKKLRDIHSNYNNIYKQLTGGKELPPYDDVHPLDSKAIQSGFTPEQISEYKKLKGVVK